jgi:hypothetical protein
MAQGNSARAILCGPHCNGGGGCVAMGDADILAKLSRILETHNLSGDNEEESTNIEDILHNISVEAGIRFEDYNDDDLSRTKCVTFPLPSQQD